MSSSQFAIALCLLGGAALTAHADMPPSCGCDKGYYEKVVTAYKQICREEKCPTVVRKPYVRYEMKPYTTTILVNKEVMVKRPREIQVPVEQTVTRCRKVPIKLMDPDTGCCIITYKTESYPCKIIVMKTQTVMVDCKVCIQVPQDQVIMKSCPVWDWRDETVIVTRQHCEMVPYQRTIRVPCPPPGPNYRVPVPLGPVPMEPNGPFGNLSTMSR